MALINPYAVMRNTATLEAFRKRQADLMRSSQPFASVAGFCLLVGGECALFAFPERGVLRVLFPWSQLVCAGLILAGVVCVTIAVIRTRRFSREHPIPDEWRQVPRSNPLDSARKARLLSRN